MLLLLMITSALKKTGSFTVEFTIKVCVLKLYCSILYTFILYQIEGNPRLCDSVIRGITRLSNPVDEYNHETKHDPESIETNSDTYIAKYTVRNLHQLLNYVFNCQIEDTLNNIKDTVYQKFSK